MNSTMTQRAAAKMMAHSIRRQIEWMAADGATMSAIDRMAHQFSSIDALINYLDHFCTGDELFNFLYNDAVMLFNRSTKIATGKSAAEWLELIGYRMPMNVPLEDSITRFGFQLDPSKGWGH